MALMRRPRGCEPTRPAPRSRTRLAHPSAASAWRRLLRDGRVYVAEPTPGGVLVTVLSAGEGGVRRILLGGDARGVAAFLLEDATGRPPPAERIAAFAGDVLGDASPAERLVVTSLDLCCWAVVHAALDEGPR
jgi:hypothetical protein